MSLCPVCGRVMCDHTLAERGQTPEEMSRDLTLEELKAWEDCPSDDPRKIAVARRYQHHVLTQEDRQEVEAHRKQRQQEEEGVSIDLKDLRNLARIASQVDWELMRLRRGETLTEDQLRRLQEGIELIKILKIAEKISKQKMEGIHTDPDHYQAYFAVFHQFFGEVNLGKIDGLYHREVYYKIHELLAEELRKPLLKILEDYEGVAEKLQKLLENPQKFSKYELDILREQFATLSLLLSY